MTKWTLEQKTDAAEIITLKSKNSKQRTEISRLTMALEKATKEKLSLLQDIKWMRGEKTGT